MQSPQPQPQKGLLAKLLHDATAQLMAGLGVALILAIIGSVNSILGANREDFGNPQRRAIAVLCFLPVLAWTIYCFRATRASSLHSSYVLPRYSGEIRLVSLGLALVVSGFTVWAFVPPPPFSIPSINLELRNDSSSPVRIDRRVELSIGYQVAPLHMNQVAYGELELEFSGGNTARDALIAPNAGWLTADPGESLVVSGAVRNPDRYRRLFEAGDAKMTIIVRRDDGTYATFEDISFDKQTLAENVFVIRVNK